MAGSATNPDLILHGNFDTGTNLYDGTDWTHVLGGDGFKPMIDYQNPQYMYASSQCNFKRSENSGGNFSFSASPTICCNGNNITCNTKGWDTHAELNTQNPQIFYQAIYDVWRTTDRGNAGSWLKISDFYSPPFNITVPYAYKIFTAPTNPDYLYLHLLDGSSGGPWVHRIFKTTDANNPDNTAIVWTEISQPSVQWISGITVDDDDPEIFWLAYSGWTPDTAKVFKYNGHTDIWTNLTTKGWPNLSYPYRRVKSIVQENGSDDGLYVGTTAGIYYTNNSMSSWMLFNDGLPNVIVRDLEINYCARKLRAATYGRGIWESEIVTTTTPLVITGDVVWEKDKRLDRDIVIDPLASLTINGRISMPPDGRIIVKRGARLEINGTVTNGCNNNLWKHIEVWGNPSLPHPSVAQVLSGVYPSDPNHHGVVIIKNGALIENSSNGVSLVKSTSSGIDINYSGGIVIAENSTFRNNMKAVGFVKYDHPNVSYFKNCIFERTAPLIDPALTYNPFITMWSVHRVRFKGCTFQNTVSTFYGNQNDWGIYSIDADFKVTAICNQSNPFGNCTSEDRNEFNNLTRGIYARGISSSATTFPIRIDKADFSGCWRSILLRAIDNANVTRNNIDVGPAIDGHTSYGLYLDGCDAFRVEENDFTGINGGWFGIYITNSGINDNEIYNNVFHDIFAGIALSLNNSGLQLKCNSFSNLSGVGENILIFSGEIRTEQGICSTGDETTPAGNQFTSFCNIGAQHIYANPGVTPFNYNSHSNLQPVCYNTDIVNVNDCGIDFDIDLSCPSTFAPPCNIPCNVIKIEKLGIQIALLASNIDGGNTADLLNFINKIPPERPHKIKMRLDSIGPYLSNEVLEALINRSPVLPPGMLRDILIKNSHLKDHVWQIIQNRVPQLPPVYMQQIQNMQTGMSPRDTLEKKIAHYRSERQLKINALIRKYSENGQTDSAIAFLEKENTINSRRMLIPIYIRKDDAANAQIHLTQIPPDNDELTQFVKLYNVHIDLMNNGKTLKQIDQGHEQEIRNIASTNTLASIQAKNILNWVFGEQYPELIEEIISGNNARISNIDLSPKVNELKENDKEAFYSIFPNPATESVTFLYKLPVNVENGIITIYNTLGKKVKNINITKEENQTKLITGEMNNGLYFCILNVNGKTIAKTKLLIIK